MTTAGQQPKRLGLLRRQTTLRFQHAAVELIRVPFAPVGLRRRARTRVLAAFDAHALVTRL